MCRNRTHPTPSEVTTVLKTAGHTSTHSLPYHFSPGGRIEVMARFVQVALNV